MITSAIGKMFLDAYNKKYKKQYDAKTFFVEQYYPLFFGHEKYMMTAGNSPLENPKISWDKMIRGQKPYETETRRMERFDALMDKIENSEADASIAIGYPSLDVSATTSGQVSNVKSLKSVDEVYLSWIGAGLGVGVQGGFSILFNNTEILLDIFEGWIIYRKTLDKNPILKGNQINTWNGQWLAYKYDKSIYVESNPMANFAPFSTNDGVMSIDVQSWTKVLIRISKQFETPIMMGYVYNFGQTNTTIGFIPFTLNQIKKPIELYHKLFGMEESKKAEELYGTAFGFAMACQAGAIGVKAMEPKGLTEYMKGKMPKYDDKQKINFQTYITWIIAMLNNQEMWAKAQEFATELQTYASSGDRGKSVNSRKVDSIMKSTNKALFMKSLVEVVEDAKNKENIESIAKLVNDMPYDNVPYFLTLVRFHYAYISNNNKK